jgi:hypothetical protein
VQSIIGYAQVDSEMGYNARNDEIRQIPKINIDLPNPLRPTNFIPTKLPSGKSLNLPHCYPIFPAWTKPTEAFLFGGKQLLNYRGVPVFAELYVLRLLQEHGWEGAWISSFGGRRCMRDMPVDAKLSNCIKLQSDREEILSKLHPRVAVALMFSRGEVTMSSFANASEPSATSFKTLNLDGLMRPYIAN